MIIWVFFSLMIFTKTLRTQEDLNACMKELHASEESYKIMLNEKSVLEQKVQMHETKKNDEVFSICFYFLLDYVHFYMLTQ